MGQKHSGVSVIQAVGFIWHASASTFARFVHRTLTKSTLVRVHVQYKREMARGPATAFIVTGQCRQGGSVFKPNVSIAAATRLFLESHAKHVVLPFDMDTNASAVFLLLQEEDTGACGGEELCNMYSYHVRMPCQYMRIASSSCPRACPKCKMLRNGLPALLHSSCFSHNVLATWTPLWCSMWLAWDHVQQHEQSSLNGGRERGGAAVSARHLCD